MVSLGCPSSVISRLPVRDPPVTPLNRILMREPAYVVDLPHVYSGKVRDIYDAGDDRYFIIQIHV